MRACVRLCACVCVRAWCSFCFVLKGKMVTTPFVQTFTAFLFRTQTYLIYRSGGALAMGGDCWACLVVFGGAGCVWYVVWPCMRVRVVLPTASLPATQPHHLCCWCFTKCRTLPQHAIRFLLLRPHPARRACGSVKGAKDDVKAMSKMKASNVGIDIIIAEATSIVPSPLPSNCTPHRPVAVK